MVRGYGRMTGKRKRVGLVHVYTGDGKGKTTAALGLALRAAGYGLKTVMIQFIKATECGEHYAASRLQPYLRIEQIGNGFVTGEPGTPAVRHAAHALWTARSIMVSDGADVLILDEINCAVACGLIGVSDVIALLEARPAHVELVLTGRGAPAEVCERADLVTEMKARKHPYQQGVLAREGIDF